MSRNKLYGLILALTLAGAAWLFISGRYLQNPEATVCLMKHTLGVPCPSCGSTRSVVYLLNGNIGEAMMTNPLGLLLAAGLILFPFWITADVVSGRSSFYRFYLKGEIVLRKRWIALPAIALIIANWIWNISKGL